MADNNNINVEADTEATAGRGHSNVKRRKPTPLPKTQLSVLLYMQLAEPITFFVMLPFVVQLVGETGVTGGDVTKVGYYTGLADSLFFLAEALTILQWGRLSDRIGRRPILFSGLIGLALSILSFGLSHSFPTFVASRALAGLLNGNKGIIKAALGEIADPSNMAQAFAFVPLTWATGNTVSPLIGGMLQHPYERLGGAFHTEFWRRNPYFLPCLVAALVSLSAFFLGFFFLKETAPSQARTPPHSLERTPLLPKPQNPLAKLPTLSTLLTPRILLVFLAYGLLGITDVSFYVLQPLVFSTPIVHGGLGLSPPTIGTIIALFGFSRGVVSASCFARATRRWGEKRVAVVCVFAFVGCYALYPVMNLLARRGGGTGAGQVTVWVWLALGVQMALATMPCMGYACIFVYLTASTPSPSLLGTTNGLAQTTVSLARTLGPASVSSLFAFSIRRNAMGGALVYLVMCVLAGATGLVVGMLPEKPWGKGSM